mgnify:CR=1 FL=1
MFDSKVNDASVKYFGYINNDANMLCMLYIVYVVNLFWDQLYNYI